MASSPGPAEFGAGEANNPPVQGLVDVLVLALWWDICLPGGASRDLAQSLLAERTPIWQQRDASKVLIPAACGAGDSRSSSCCIKPERSGCSQKGVAVLCRHPDFLGPGCSGLCFPFAPAACGDALASASSTVPSLCACKAGA